MLQLHTDPTFHFEILRGLGYARYSGSDVAEILTASPKIKPGDFESWHDVFFELAKNVESNARDVDPLKYPVTVRDSMFRAASYYRSADFYLHGNKTDPRIKSLWDLQTACFDKAIKLLPIPGERITVQTPHGFTVPTIFYRSTLDTKTPRPTLLLGSGFDGSQEELLHVLGLAALERDINVITYEGPGQCAVVREQGLGFIADWEKVVTPVLDHYLKPGAFPQIAPDKVGLFGYSLGGYLAPRAAAFDPRIAALIAVDGVYEAFDSVVKVTMPPPALALLAAGKKDELDAAVIAMLQNPGVSTSARWGIEHGLWSFQIDSVYDCFQRFKAMSMAGIAGKIKCPALILDAEGDEFFGGDQKNKSQPQLLAEAIGDKAKWVPLTTKDAAASHCHIGAAVRMNQILFDWFEEVVA